MVKPVEPVVGLIEPIVGFIKPAIRLIESTIGLNEPTDSTYAFCTETTTFPKGIGSLYEEFI